MTCYIILSHYIARSQTAKIDPKVQNAPEFEHIFPDQTSRSWPYVSICEQAGGDVQSGPRGPPSSQAGRKASECGPSPQ